MFRDKRGYTLIELIVVVLLIGLVLTLTAPRLRDSLLSDDLKSAARRLIGITNDLRNEAIREQSDYFLHLDLDRGRFWITHGSMSEDERALAAEKGSNLPPRVNIRDVWIRGKGKVTGGEARIGFTRRGYTQESVVHLNSQDGRDLTLILSPFMGRVKIVDKYVGFD
ncbi:MAG: prepilin-type N-terminal cleavage/methylation domain-containing protein [Deltaproteobacteria bacterium]|nr:prepilin-type N-terminal cleavage/methylation domain-containing protein [Deltaproteobacteria bacterium]